MPDPFDYRKDLKNQLAEKWKSSAASHKHPRATFEILDTSELAAKFPDTGGAAL
jgi:hypothetical protein